MGTLIVNKIAANIFLKHLKEIWNLIIDLIRRKFITGIVECI